MREVTSDYNNKLNLFLEKTKKDFSFDAVAVRIIDPLFYMPFAAHNGLSASFVEEESLISITECICGKIARLDTPRELSYFTGRGSFWSNHLKEEVVEKLVKSGIELRGRCVREGYKTLLISPMMTGNGVRGNLFLASQKENLLTKEDVNFLENKATMFGKKVLGKLTECERYNIIARMLAQSNGEDIQIFGKYFEHIKNCSPCHDFYRQRLKFDNFIQKIMFQLTSPYNLKSKIIESLSKVTSGLITRRSAIGNHKS